jgi:hypothetical protein
LQQKALLFEDFVGATEHRNAFAASSAGTL